MIARVLEASAAVAVLSLSGAAAAQSAPSAPEAPVAETLFTTAKQLRDSGKLAEACADFAESKRLAPGVGVSLYLGDCYERMGRTASAWSQFREAEALALDRKDKRAATAQAHAAALEPKLSRILVVLSATTAGARPDVRIDGGASVSEHDWTTGVPVDPGDHVVTVSVPGEATRSAKAHLDAGPCVVKVAIADPQRAPVAAPKAPAVAAVTSAPVIAAVPSDDSTRTWVGYGLLGAGVAGAGIGTALLVAKNRSMANDGSGPQVDQGAAIGSAIAYGAAGAAFVSAIVLYLTEPTPKESALIVAPTPMVGGGGAVVRASF